MEKKSITLNIIIIILVHFFLIQCEFENSEESIPPPSTTLFSGTDLIELQLPLHNDTLFHSNTIFQFSDIQDNIEYLVFGIFEEDIQIDSDNRIVNVDNWVAGNRTNLPGFSRSSIDLDNVFFYDLDSLDFDTEEHFEDENLKQYYWAIWGFDVNYNLIASSPRWIVYVDWD